MENNKDKKYFVVYQHLFPNGKSYIGITSTDVNKRWRDGEGYKNQPKMKRAIDKYGWNNIEHNILKSQLSKDEAETIEQEMIVKYNSIENGYNVSIGGKLSRSYYLLPEVSVLLNSLKHFFNMEIPRIYYENKDVSEILNEHYLIVVNNYPKRFSMSDEFDVAKLWVEISYCMDISYRLSENLPIISKSEYLLRGGDAV